MTIKELINALNEAARDSKKGMDSIVNIMCAEEWCESEICELYVTCKNTVTIRDTPY